MSNESKLALRKGLMQFLLGWAMLVTLARGIRYPNDFAESFWLLDYRFGLIKRGFLGTVETLLDNAGIISLTERSIRIEAFSFLAVFCLLLLALMRRVLVRTDWSLESFLVMSVFASSPFIVMSAHLVGYVDNLFLLCTALSIGLLLRNRVWGAAVLFSVAILIHESAMVVGFPLVALTAFVLWKKGDGPAASRKHFTPLFLPLLVAGALLVSEQLTNQPVLKTLMTIRLEKYPFIQDNMAMRVPKWLTVSGFDFFLGQSPSFVGRVFSHYTVIVLPSILTLLTFALWNLRPPLFKMRSFALLLSVALLPFLLHAVAWDSSRIATYVIFTSFICVWLFAETSPSSPPASWKAARLLFVLSCLVFNTLSHLELMDYRVENLTTLSRLAWYAPVVVGILIDLLRRRSREPVLPSRIAL